MRACVRLYVCVYACVVGEGGVGVEVPIHHMKGDSQNASVTPMETKAREDDGA